MPANIYYVEAKWISRLATFGLCADNVGFLEFLLEAIRSLAVIGLYPVQEPTQAMQVLPPRMLGQ
ncbi:uncharacterized protein N7479_008899 [Penicillium vulpinum]|uniref:uncharacterized protein n=1 Tax=Penicillium vulpinum TaxID=29845 RepID=UPI002548A96C|nr:uncharacterized protein N7479_008899 [Penicillium vulpinum]KAJ5950486.1 hypothetical protein N7479_008899 [Penicillium vulpinum]